jgi:hypothetical protein
MKKEKIIIKGKRHFSKPMKVDFLEGTIELTYNDLIRQVKKIGGLPSLLKLLKRFKNL